MKWSVVFVFDLATSRYLARTSTTNTRGHVFSFQPWVFHPPRLIRYRTVHCQQSTMAQTLLSSRDFKYVCLANKRRKVYSIELLYYMTVTSGNSAKNLNCLANNTANPSEGTESQILNTYVYQIKTNFTPHNHPVSLHIFIRSYLRKK